MSDYRDSAVTAGISHTEDACPVCGDFVDGLECIRVWRARVDVKGNPPAEMYIHQSCAARIAITLLGGLT